MSDKFNFILDVINNFDNILKPESNNEKKESINEITIKLINPPEGVPEKLIIHDAKNNKHVRKNGYLKALFNGDRYNDVGKKTFIYDCKNNLIYYQALRWWIDYFNLELFIKKYKFDITAENLKNLGISSDKLCEQLTIPKEILTGTGIDCEKLKSQLNSKKLTKEKISKLGISSNNPGVIVISKNDLANLKVPYNNLINLKFTQESLEEYKHSTNWDNFSKGLSKEELAKLKITEDTIFTEQCTKDMISSYFYDAINKTSVDEVINKMSMDEFINFYINIYMLADYFCDFSVLDGMLTFIKSAHFPLEVYNHFLSFIKDLEDKVLNKAINIEELESILNPEELDDILLEVILNSEEAIINNYGIEGKIFDSFEQTDALRDNIYLNKLKELLISRQEQKENIIKKISFLGDKLQFYMLMDNQLNQEVLKFKEDKEVIMLMVKQEGVMLQYANDALKNDKDVVLEAVKQNVNALQFASDDFIKNNKEIVFAAVKQNDRALAYVSDVLRIDKEVIFTVGTQNDEALEFANNDLKNDKAFILKAIKQNGNALQFASNALKNDKDVVLAAVTQNGNALQFASDALKNDKNIILAAVTLNGFVLRFASDALKNDKNIVLAAVTQNGGALVYASDTLKNDKEVVLAALKSNNLIFGQVNINNNPMNTNQHQVTANNKRRKLN